MANLNAVRLVLVRTYHPGNIGSAARSAKTMQMTNLHLVSPRDFPSEEATKMAAGASDILESTVVHGALSEAVHDCRLIIAATARPRGYDLPEVLPEQAAKMLLEHSTKNDVALVFGPERMGLHNKDLELAQYRLTIPANPDYSSLNLAAAVQVMSYELFKSSSHIARTTNNQVKALNPLASAQEFEQLVTQLEQLLRETKFLRSHTGETVQRIRTFLRKAQPNQLETNIMRGAVKSILRSVAKNKMAE